MNPESIIFDPLKYTLIIPIDEKKIDIKTFNNFAQQNGFSKKDKFHITIIGFQMAQKISDILEKLGDKKRKSAIEDIQALIDNTDWKFNFIDDYFRLQKEYEFNNKGSGGKIKEKRESIIQLVSMPGVDKFWNELNNLLPTDLERPFIHLTVFIKTDKKGQTEGIGISSLSEFEKLQPEKLSDNSTTKFHTIILPTRPHPDTLIAIFLLKKFGNSSFPGIKDAKINFLQIMPEGKSVESYEKEGLFLVDIGGGRFDHHNKHIQTTSSDLIVKYLNIENDKALSKLLEYARRDDFYGKGTLSTDSLDRAFGLSGLIAAMNKTYNDEPTKVIAIVTSLLEAHYNEEHKRTDEMPKEAEQKLREGKATTFNVKQKKNNLKVIYIESDNTSLPGFLRSQQGGRYDIVAQRVPSGHINILTRPTKRVDLRPLAALIRNAELMLKGNEYNPDSKKLSKSGRIENVPEWYFDEATNSILNGGVNPAGINPTKIPAKNLLEIIKLAFKG